MTIELRRTRGGSGSIRYPCIMCDVCDKMIKGGNGLMVLLSDKPYMTLTDVAFVHKGRCDREIDPNHEKPSDEIETFVTNLAFNTTATGISNNIVADEMGFINPQKLGGK